MTAPVNFLVSSAGRRGALVEILRQVVDMHGRGGGVYAVDRSDQTAAGWLADGLDLVPPVHDPWFVDAMLDVCARRRITHLVPTIDPELAVLAENRARFETIGTRVWVSDPATIAVAQDKRRTARFLDDHGFPRVGQRDFVDLASGEGLDYPLIVKPATGSSSTGVHLVRNPQEFAVLDASQDLIVEELAPGEEYTVDVLVDSRGRCRSAVPRQRLEIRAGEVSKARTVRNVPMIELVTALAEALPGAYGVMNVQLFHDGDTFNVVEVNARFGGGFPLSWAAGAQLPLWLVQEAEGTEPTATLDWDEDQLMLRYDAAVFLDRRG